MISAAKTYATINVATGLSVTGRLEGWAGGTTIACLTLANPDGSPFPLLPGEVLWAGLGTSYERESNDPLLEVQSGIGAIADWADNDLPGGKVSIPLDLTGEEIADTVGSSPSIGAYLEVWSLGPGLASLLAHVAVALRNVAVEAP